MERTEVLYLSKNIKQDIRDYFDVNPVWRLLIYAAMKEKRN